MFPWLTLFVFCGVVSGMGSRSIPFFRMAATCLYERAPTATARVLAASNRSFPYRLPSRMIPRQERYPCSG